jgi:hypothetical protein
VDTPIPPKSNSIDEVIEFQLQKEILILKKLKKHVDYQIFFLKIDGWMKKGGIYKLIRNYLGVVWCFLWFFQGF